jgi:hypothetical protein
MIETRDVTARVAKIHLTAVRVIIQKDTTFAMSGLHGPTRHSNRAELAGLPTRRVSRSRLQVANNLLLRLHNELNLGQVLILLEKIVFSLGCQLRCDRDFEFLARRFGGPVQEIGC